MGGLLHLVQQGGDWAGLQPAEAPPRCTRCNVKFSIIGAIGPKCVTYTDTPASFYSCCPKESSKMMKELGVTFT